jgi:vibriolysin
MELCLESRCRATAHGVLNNNRLGVSEVHNEKLAGMRRKTIAIAALLTLGVAAGTATAASALPQNEARASALGFNEVVRNSQGRIDAVYGRTTLRARDSAQIEALFAGPLADVYGLSLDDTLKVKSTEGSPEGKLYHRMTQSYKGIPVWGDNVTVQTDAKGNVEALLGGTVSMPSLDVANPRDARSVIPLALNAELSARSTPVLGYRNEPSLVIYAAREHTPTLAWDARVTYTHAGQYHDERVFVDARTGNMLAVYNNIQKAINREGHNLNGACTDGSSNLPGPLVVSEGGSSSDTIVMAGYNAAGHEYWFLRNNFNRDSYDGLGSKLIISVRATFSDEGCSQGNNAFWNDVQMVIGRGGSTFTDLTGNPDVTYHELGHAVTHTTSDLAYANQSGSMNEANSDIYAAAVTAWMNTVSGQPSATTPMNFSLTPAVWTVGEGLRVGSGAPLRDMRDPASDGGSFDNLSNYLASYPNSCSPSNANDQCGVHSGSGIGNLMFYLLSVGGHNPRHNTTINVTGIGIQRAIKYLYESNSMILGANTSFSQYRNAMMTRARANGTVGACDEISVGKAWDAVGVTGTAPANPNACGTGGTVAPVANFGSTTSGLTATFTDSSTDSDGTIASRAWTFGDGGTSTATSPSHTYAAAGTYSVSLTVTDNGGLTNTKTASVTVSTTPGNVLQNGVAATGLAATTGNVVNYTMAVPAGATNLKFVMSGGTGDADMYVKFGSAPTTSSYDCRPYLTGNAETCTIATAQAGTYYVMVRAYASFTGVSLTGSYTAGTTGPLFQNTTPVAIPDNTTINSSITVSGVSGNAPAALKVGVSIHHTYQGDLAVDLIGPNGTVINLWNHTGAGTDNIIQTFTVNASAIPANGVWKLRVTDNATQDTGTLDNWSLQF